MSGDKHENGQAEEMDHGDDTQSPLFGCISAIVQRDTDLHNNGSVCQARFSTSTPLKKKVCRKEGNFLR